METKYDKILTIRKVKKKLGIKWYRFKLIHWIVFVLLILNIYIAGLLLGYVIWGL